MIKLTRLPNPADKHEGCEIAEDLFEILRTTVLDNE